MPESSFIGFIHWPRLWAMSPPDIDNFDPSILKNTVWEGTLGHQGITLRIRHEGSFLFDLGSYRGGILAPKQNGDIDEIISTDGRRCDFFNAYLYCLYTCFHSEQHHSQEKMTAKTKSLILEGELCLSAKQDELTIALTQACFGSTYHPLQPRFADFRVRTAPNWYLTGQTLTKTAELFSQILDHEKSEELIQLCSLQLQAYVSAEQHMYRHSLAHAFMVTELIVDQKYDKPNNHDGVFKKIKKLCADGGDLPICAPCRKDFKNSETKCDSPASTRVCGHSP